jgi:hypothetical protein
MPRSDLAGAWWPGGVGVDGDRELESGQLLLELVEGGLAQEVYARNHAGSRQVWMVYFARRSTKSSTQGWPSGCAHAEQAAELMMSRWWVRRSRTVGAWWRERAMMLIHRAWHAPSFRTTPWSACPQSASSSSMPSSQALPPTTRDEPAVCLPSRDEGGAGIEPKNESTPPPRTLGRPSQGRGRP